MLSLEQFEKAVIREVVIALKVAASPKGDAHTDRAYQGLVMNEPHGRRIYYFSDGTEMLTEGGEVFFLPKGSTYKVNPVGETLSDSGCYAINFDADISLPPFTVKPRNPESLEKLFSRAARSWKNGDATAHPIAMASLYNIMAELVKESERAYVPKEKERLISPAIEIIKSDFTASDLTVSTLAAACGISQVYFRKLFRDIYGVSPKEYIVAKRINYAATLLASGEFSVSRVAELCGYAEPCHFSREFSRLKGVSPSEYLGRR